MAEVMDDVVRLGDARVWLTQKVLELAQAWRAATRDEREALEKSEADRIREGYAAALRRMGRAFSPRFGAPKIEVRAFGVRKGPRSLAMVEVYYETPGCGYPELRYYFRAPHDTKVAKRYEKLNRLMDVSWTTAARFVGVALAEWRIKHKKIRRNDLPEIAVLALEHWQKDFAATRF